MSVIHNEQTKLTATALNNLAVATVIAGFVGPTVALRLPPAGLQVDAFAVAVSVAWLLSDGSYTWSRGSSCWG